MEGPKVRSEASIAEGLVRRIVKGDITAEKDMVERYQRGLSTMLFNNSKDKFVAEDIAQETWLLVLGKIRNGELRNSKKLAAFIVQTGKNQLIMYYRRQRRYSHVSDDKLFDLADKNPSPEQDLQNTQFGQTVKQILADMTIERDRELLRRFYLIGDDKSELCREWDLDPLHFDRVLYRARERFKAIWGSDGGDTA